MAEDPDARWPESFPWGGLLAVLLLWAVDAFVLDSPLFWERFEGTLDATPMERGVLADRLAFGRFDAGLGGTGPEYALGPEVERVSDGDLVAVLGSSRAQAGLFATPLVRMVPGIEVLGLSHAGNHPYELRALVEELVEREPDVAVLLVSEFDTHRPMRLMIQTAPGSLRALREVCEQVGWGFVFEHRTTFLQVALASVFDAYRYRELYAAAGVTEWRVFRAPDARPTGSVSDIPFLLEGEDRLPMRIPQEMKRLEAVYPGLAPRARMAGLKQVRSITRGPHAAVQSELLRSTVTRLREEGCLVLLVEGPLAPVTDGYYDATIRDEFLALARDIASDPGVLFLPLEELGEFPQELFKDLTHLKPEGARQLSTVVGHWVRRMIEARDEGRLERAGLRPRAGGAPAAGAKDG